MPESVFTPIIVVTTDDDDGNPRITSIDWCDSYQDTYTADGMSIGHPAGQPACDYLDDRASDLTALLLADEDKINKIKRDAMIADLQDLTTTLTRFNGHTLDVET